jgi:hypothetical protein
MVLGSGLARTRFPKQCAIMFQYSRSGKQREAALPLATPFISYMRNTHVYILTHCMQVSQVIVDWGSAKKDQVNV